jgi:thioredoxin 1
MKLTTEQFEEKIQNGFSGMIDFYADWCGPCKAIAPLLEKINEELGEEKIYKINVDESKETAIKYGITSIPTMIFFKDGEVKNKIVGMTNKKAILENLNS